MQKILKNGLILFMMTMVFLSVTGIQTAAEGAGQEIYIAFPNDYNSEGITLSNSWSDSTDRKSVSDTENKTMIFEMFVGDKITTHVGSVNGPLWENGQYTLNVSFSDSGFADYSTDEDYSINVLFKKTGEATMTVKVMDNGTQIGTQQMRFRVVAAKQTTAKISKSIKVGDKMPEWYIQNPIYGSEYKIERTLNTVKVTYVPRVKGSDLQYDAPKSLSIMNDYYATAGGVYTESLYVKTPSDTSYKLLAKEDITVVKPSYIPDGYIESICRGDSDEGISIIMPAQVLEKRIVSVALLIERGNENYKKEYEALYSKFKNDFLLYDLRVLDLDADVGEDAIQPSMFANCPYFKVKVPIPANYDRSKLEVYYVSSDGTMKKANGTVDGDYFIFEAEHFSAYALVQNMNIQNNITTNNPKVSNPKTGDAQLLVIYLLMAAVFITAVPVYKLKLLK